MYFRCLTPARFAAFDQRGQSAASNLRTVWQWKVQREVEAVPGIFAFSGVGSVNHPLQEPEVLHLPFQRFLVSFLQVMGLTGGTQPTSVGSRGTKGVTFNA